MNLLQTTKEGNIIVHSPQFDSVAVEKLYSDKDGVPVKYVCTTQHQGANYFDIFFRSTPHPEFGNKYFGLTRGGQGQLFISGADWIEQLEFNCIVDTEGHFHYSRGLHDFVEVGEAFIDGGREYVRTGGDVLGAQTFKVRDGEYYEV